VAEGRNETIRRVSTILTLPKEPELLLSAPSGAVWEISISHPFHSIGNRPKPEGVAMTISLTANPQEY
jgi:hypothetical protein